MNDGENGVGFAGNGAARMRVILGAALVASAMWSAQAFAACATNEDCKHGRVCDNGECAEPVVHCSKDRDCEGDNVCVSGTCAAPPPRSRKIGDFAWDAEVFGAGLFSGSALQLGYGGLGAGGIWLSSKAALLLQAELMLANGADVRQVFLGPAIRVHRWGAVSGNFALGVVFMKQPENTFTQDFYKSLGFSVSSWYELSGPFSFIYGAELALPLGQDSAAVHGPQLVYGIILGLGWVQQ